MPLSWNEVGPLARYGWILLVLFLSGCASSPPAPVDDRSTEYRQTPVILDKGTTRQSERLNGRDPLTAAILRTAESQKGVPYRYGGDQPERGFDCSGLVTFTFGSHGIELPRTAREQIRHAQSVDPGELRQGDLVFFQVNGSRVDHVGIYAGDGQFLHAPSRGGVVSYASLDDPYWQRRFTGAGRVLAME